MYAQYEMSFFNMVQGVPSVRKQGNGIEFHEFAILEWVDFLKTTGFSMTSNEPEYINKRHLQFEELIDYDHRIGDGAKITYAQIKNGAGLSKANNDRY